MRKLAAIVFALNLFLTSLASAQEQRGPFAQPGSSGRTFANLNQSVSTMDGFGAVGDAQEFTFVVCFQSTTGFCPNSSQAANVVAFVSPQNGTLSTTLTGTAGGGTLTAANHFCTSEMSGEPMYIPGAGQNGGGLLTRLIGCIGSQAGGGSTQFAVNPPVAQVPSGTVTIAYGAMALNNGQGWLASDVGKGITIGEASGGGNGGSYTISSVTSPTLIVLSANVGNIIQNAAQEVVWGHDDSTPVSNACAAVLASGLRALQIPAKHYVPTLAWSCYGVRRYGNGLLLAAGGTIGSFANVGNVREVVVPDNAPPPAPPVKAVIASRDLAQTRACGPTPTLVNTGDSLETLFPNALSGLGTYINAIQSAFQRQNSSITPTWRNAGVGGATVANFDSNPAGTNGDVITSTGSPWLTQVAGVTPCGMTIGFGNNDGIGLSLPALVDSYLKMTQTSAGVFTTLPDIMYITHHPYSATNAGAGGTSNIYQGDYASGYICSFARLMSRPCIDGAREGEKHLHGYDPGALRLVRRYDLPFNTNALGLPSNPSIYFPGFSSQFQKAGQNGATFWANFTGNGGITDTRGPFIAFFIGRDPTNILWLFYNGTNIGYECDPSAGLPGFGCWGPNGVPPVTPSRLSNLTVANVGGFAQINSSAAIFGNGTTGPCIVGQTVALPGAGAILTPPGFASYTAPLISTIKSCDSTSQMTLNAAPINTYAAQSGFVMFGNPVVFSNVTDASNCTNEPFSVEVVNDQVRIWFCSQWQVVYAGPIMRPRTDFAPRIFSGGNRPSITIAGDALTGETTFQVPVPVPNQMTYTDDEVSGPAANAPLSNAAYSGIEGGDGNNHNTMAYGTRVIQSLMDAQDFGLGLSSGIHTDVPLTGFTIAMPAGYEMEVLNPAGTLATGTFTLPCNYPVGKEFTLSSTQTVTGLTVNACSGDTADSVPTTIAATAANKWRRTSNTQWIRLQ